MFSSHTKSRIALMGILSLGLLSGGMHNLQAKQGPQRRALDGNGNPISPEIMAQINSHLVAPRSKIMLELPARVPVFDTISPRLPPDQKQRAMLKLQESWGMAAMEMYIVDNNLSMGHSQMVQVTRNTALPLTSLEARFTISVAMSDTLNVYRSLFVTVWKYPDIGTVIRYHALPSKAAPSPQSKITLPQGFKIKP